MATSFTPVSALAGGLLIGGAALVLFLALGRIAGVSGVLGGVLRKGGALPDGAWRWAFLLGLPAGAALAGAVLHAPLVHPSPAGLPVLIAAGLLVGVGTGMANGCTSGHGVCGVARLSRRSLVATAAFMAFGFVTASIAGGLLQG